MTTMTCALVLDRDAIPSVTAVVSHLAECGHTVTFPRGFEFAHDDRGLWRPITLDGTKTGFDCVLSPVASRADDDPESVQQLNGLGSHLLEFGARGQESVHAMTVVLGAICDLSDASGWVEEEVIPADEMLLFLDGVANSQDEVAKRIAALPQPTKAEQEAAFKALTDRRPAAPSQDRTRSLAIWVLAALAAGLFGWWMAVYR